jgi:hypothetical protein
MPDEFQAEPRRPIRSALQAESSEPNPFLKPEFRGQAFKAAPPVRVNVPENCPSCDRRLVSTYFLAPKPKWRWQAKLLLLLGVTLSGALLVLALVLAGGVVGGLAIREGEGLGLFPSKERNQWGLLVFFTWAILAILAFFPAVGLALIAARMPKRLTMKCRCGWSSSLLIADRRDTRQPGA